MDVLIGGQIRGADFEGYGLAVGRNLGIGDALDLEQRVDRERLFLREQNAGYEREDEARRFAHKGNYLAPWSIATKGYYGGTIWR